MGSEVYKILGELELYNLDNFLEELFIFLQESENVGTFSVDFDEKCK